MADVERSDARREINELVSIDILDYCSLCGCGNNAGCVGDTTRHHRVTAGKNGPRDGSRNLGHESDRRQNDAQSLAVK